MGMAPSWVLLDRHVLFPHHPFGMKEGDELVGLMRPPSDEEMSERIALFLQTLTPDFRLVNPPILSSFRMLPPNSNIPPLCAYVTSAVISSSHKNLVALYAGSYRPGTLAKGCYLIYNARKNSLSTIPQLPLDHCLSHAPIGRQSALVVSQGHGYRYLLAELIKVTSSGVTDAELYLWRSSERSWTVKACQLPRVIFQPTGNFCADMCFFYEEGSTLCWVDLFKGLLVCDLSQVLDYNSDLEFGFIPLPGACPAYNINSIEGRQLQAEEFRSMACVKGAIRFVTMDGYVQHQPGKDLELAVWTLSSDLSTWRKTSQYNVEDIWKNETHQSLGMPKLAPSLPVLSMSEDDVVYLVFTDMRVDVGGRKLDYKGQYLLRVDMGNNKVGFYPARTEWIHSQFMASDFSAYLQVAGNHPREVEASGSGEAGGKRKKLRGLNTIASGNLD